MVLGIYFLEVCFTASTSASERLLSTHGVIQATCSTTSESTLKTFWATWKPNLRPYYVQLKRHTNAPLGKNRHFHRTVLAYVNQVFQQISGINLITYYAAQIYEQYIGLTPFTSRILAAANGTEYFLASWIAVFTIERFGRRSLMLFGAVGMSLSMAVLAATTSQNGTGAGIVAAAFLFIFNTFFAIGWLGMTWLYPAEIVPLRIRAPANALSTSANWAFNFMVVMITPVAFENIGYQTYIIFAVM